MPEIKVPVYFNFSHMDISNASQHKILDMEFPSLVTLLTVEGDNFLVLDLDNGDYGYNRLLTV